MRVAIVGGSVGGLFAASLLRKAGHHVEVFERSRSGLEGRGAGLVAQEKVFTALSMIGREDVAEVGVVATERITLDRFGAVIDRDPRPQMQISWDHLYSALRSSVSDGAYHTGKTVVAAGETDHAAWIRFENGEYIEADIVVGADGIGSTVRQAVVGDRAEATYSGYVAWRFLLQERSLPPLAALVLSGRFAFFHMEGGQVLGYLVAGPSGETAEGQRRYNCVWYRQERDLKSIFTDRDGLLHRYSLAAGRVPDMVRRGLITDAERMLPLPFASVITAEPSPFVQGIFDMVAPTMVHGRLVLLGDAAFVVRPHTAMGVAKAAGDAMDLAKALSKPELSDALRTYDRDRRRAGNLISQYGRRLGASLEPSVATRGSLPRPQ